MDETEEVGGVGPPRSDDPQYTHLQETVMLYSLFIRILLADFGKPFHITPTHAQMAAGWPNFVIDNQGEVGVSIYMPGQKVAMN